MTPTRVRRHNTGERWTDLIVVCANRIRTLRKIQPGRGKVILGSFPAGHVNQTFIVDDWQLPPVKGTDYTIRKT